MVKDSEIGNIAAIGPGRPPALFEIRAADRRRQAGAGPDNGRRSPLRRDRAARSDRSGGSRQIIVPILVGPAAKIAAVAREHRLDISRFEIVDVPHSYTAAAKAG
jgi:hypothetical protein